MKIIKTNRGQGKTTELIKISNREWKYIVCLDKGRVKNIVSIANEMGLEIPFPLTVSKLPLTFGQRIGSVLVDDVEDVLEWLINREVDYATTSCEVREIEHE